MGDARARAYHSTKISEIFETETNGTEISREKFQKIRKFLHFRKGSHSTENFGNFLKLCEFAFFLFSASSSGHVEHLTQG